jgi:hypothetical protein
MNRQRLIATVLAAAAIAAVLLVSRCATTPDAGTGQPGAATASAAPAPSAPASAVPSTPEHTEEDDGTADTSDAPAVITAGPASATEAAIQVAVKLLNTTGKTAEQWRAGLRPFVNDALYEQLAEADPATVPVGQVDDAHVKVAAAGDALVVATVPVVDSSSPPRTVATIRVTLSGASHRWLATELDVERAP